MQATVSKHGPLSMGSHSTTNLAIMSAVRSVSSLTTSRANLGPLSSWKLIRFFMVTNLRFLRSTITFASGCVWVCEMVRSWSRVTSLIEGAYIKFPASATAQLQRQSTRSVPRAFLTNLSPSFLIHPSFNAFPWPTFAVFAPTSFYSLNQHCHSIPLPHAGYINIQAIH